MEKALFALLVSFVAFSAGNVLGHPARGDTVCFSLNTLRFGWCYPNPRQTLPIIKGTTLTREAMIITVTGASWLLLAKKPA